jgi:hypothetical protein
MWFWTPPASKFLVKASGRCGAKTVQKIENSGMSVQQVVDDFHSNGGKPGVLFEVQEGEKSYKVWAI